MLVPAALLTLYCWRASRSWQLVVAFLGGALLPAIGLGAYHTACFGRPWSTGYRYVADSFFAENMARGFMGITRPDPWVLIQSLFGTYRGIFFLSPVLLFGVFGLRKMLRTRFREEAIGFSFIVVYLLVLSSSYYMWWGGAAMGPRHLIPMLPFLALPIAFTSSGPSRVGAWILLAWSLVTMLIATAVGPEAPEAADPAIAFHWSHFVSGEIAVNAGSSNLGLEFGLGGIASLIPLLALMLLCGWILFRSTGPKPPARTEGEEDVDWIPWAIAALAGLLLVATLGAPLGYQEERELIDNLFLRDLSNVWSFFSEEYYEQLSSPQRPVAVLSHMLDLQVSGLRPPGYHLHNLVLHGACAFLFYRWARARFGDGGGAVWAALFFAVLPIHVGDHCGA